MAVFVEVPIRTAPRPHHAPQPLPYITHATHLHIPYHVRRVTALLHQDRPEEDTLDLFDCYSASKMTLLFEGNEFGWNMIPKFGKPDTEIVLYA